MMIVQPRGDYEWEVDACLSARVAASGKLTPETLPEQALISFTPAIEMALPATCDVKIR
jgi:hypothetical protein